MTTAACTSPDNFRASCRHLGINFQPAHKATGSDKPHIERLFGSVGVAVRPVRVRLHRLAAPTGAAAMVEGRPLWSMLELQDLLDEWLIAFWQNRPHDGLRDPVHPGQAFTPNEKYAALVETAGYVPVALGRRRLHRTAAAHDGGRSTPTASRSIAGPTTART